MKLWKGFLVVALAMVMVISVTACGTTPGENGENGEENGNGNGNGEEVTENAHIVYVEWACASASSYLVKNIIIEELGMEAELTALNAGVMWESIASGSSDLMICAWLPRTHGEYYAEVGDDIVDLGPNYEGALIGLVVPTYVDIDSIEDLNENSDKFDGKIVGIDAGAGIMGATDDAIEEYGLELELQESSDAAMTAALGSAINDDEWIVVTGWTPHWKFAEWDLKFLEDPAGVYGGAETINTVTRLGFADDNPTIQAFLENYYVTPAQLGEVIGMMEEYDDPDEAAQAWIEQNQDLVDGWLGR